MKLDTIGNIVTSSKPKESLSFGCTLTAKAFELVATNYSNPIKAFIRELSTNAAEAHGLNGKSHVPFDVYLPTHNALNFTIRDYGPGLTLQEMKDIYTVLFCSTKDQSNDDDGCFGIGSKSPFAYAKNAPFSVTSITQGTKFYYTCYISETGEPKLDLLQSHPSDEPTGLEVSVPVRLNDVSTIHSEAEDVYLWFAVKPRIVRCSRTLNMSADSVNPAMQGVDFKIYSSNITSLVHMGNVAYPIDFSILGYKPSFGHVVITAPRGSVIPDLSREQLKYGGRTTAYLKQKLNEIDKYIVTNLSKEIDGCACYYDAVLKGQELCNAFCNVRLHQLMYKNEQLRYETKLDAPFIYSQNKTGGVKYSSSTDEFNYRYNTLFFCIDTKCYKPRILSYITSQPSYNLRSYKFVICSPANVDSVAAKIGVPVDRFVKTSDIPYVATPRTITGGSKAHKTKVLKYNGRYGIKFAWDDAQVDLTTFDGYYVEYYNNQCKYDTNDVHDLFHPNIIPRLLRFLKLPSETDVYGIKTEVLNRKKTDLSKAKNLFKVCEDWLNKNKAKLEDIANAHVFQSKWSYDYLVKALSHKQIQKPKDVEQIIEEANKINKLANTITTSDLRFITSQFNFKLNAKYTHDGLIREFDKLSKRFSLISELYKSDCLLDEVAYYILGKGF